MKTGKTSGTSLTQQLLYALRYYLGGRRGLIAGGSWQSVLAWS